MARIPRQSPSGYVVFCDEIRTEITGKHIFIGVYSGEMNLFYSALPVAIQQLAMSVSYFEEIGPHLRISSVEAYFPGDKDDEPRLKFDVPKQQIEQSRAPLPDSEEDIDLLKGVMVQMNVKNMPISESGRIKVIARIGDDVLRLGSMYIHLKTMEEGRQMGIFT